MKINIYVSYKIKITKIINRMIYLIAPYRNRPEHLKIFIQHYISLLDLEKVKIIIVEQANNKPFNKGLLHNCGIKAIQEKYNFQDEDFFILNDIDCLIKPHKLDFFLENPGETIKHIFGFDNIFFRKYPCLGGIISMNYNNFVKLNGFPNNFWGWGAEDLALGWRSKVAKVPINNSGIIKVGNTSDITRLENPKQTKTRLVKHNTNTLNISRLNLESNHIMLTRTNGYMSIKYKLINFIENPDYCHFFLDF